jgi:thioredoxin reductase (NADPH)
MLYDIIIVGGGPAGLTAAIYARRSGKSVLLLEKEGFGGQIAFSPRVDNYPGVPYVSGAELAEQMLSQVLALDTDTDIGTVCAIRDENGVKTVLTEEGDSFTGRCVIIAAGARHRQLGLPGETELVGRGVSYCAVCDGGFYTGGTVAVAGGGDSALQEALMLSEICRTVYLIHRRREFRGDVEKQRRLAARENVRFLTPMNVTALHEKDGDLTSLTLTDAETGEERELAVDALFVSVGQVPALEAFADALPLTGDGYAALGEDCTSPVPGIFAAGDCRSKEVRQLTTAVADGACAALAACRFLEVT